MKANEDVRNAICSSGVKFWQVADAYGVSDSSFTRLLRTELPRSKKEIILEIISNLASEKQSEINQCYHQSTDTFEDENISDTRVHFHRRLKYLVVYNRISYKKLSLAIGVSHQSVSNYVNGKAEPTLNNLCKIADYFGVSTDFLLGREANKYEAKKQQ